MHRIPRSDNMDFSEDEESNDGVYKARDDREDESNYR